MHDTLYQKMLHVMVVFRAYGVTTYKLQNHVCGTRTYLKKIEKYVSNGDVFELFGCRVEKLEMIYDYANVINERGNAYED